MLRRLAILALLCLAAPAAADTLIHDGIERSYDLVVPDGLALPAPAVFMLHGGGGSKERVRRSSRFHHQGEASGFVTVYPQGVEGHWNDARTAPALLEKQGGEIDDVGFLTALAARLTADGIADRRRTYATGASNGGMMSFRLACEAADTFAAIAPAIASLPVEAEETCRPSRPVPVLLMNGTEDLLIPWEGGPVAAMVPGNRGHVLPTERTVEIFRQLSGCGSATVEPAMPLDDGMRLLATRYTGCRGDASVVLYRFEGMGHRWPDALMPNLPGRLGEILGPAPRDFPAALHVWQFLKDHRLPE
ncbi:MAG: alpha/beta hydrolase family esterase [Minwuia sp.]|uniref:alpha/beta hydrolase family esterase n=1 Tax=Minwuia sp. TaxID=2493630 RepID=UPI003A89A1C4